MGGTTTVVLHRKLILLTSAVYLKHLIFERKKQWPLQTCGLATQIVFSIVLTLDEYCTNIPERGKKLFENGSMPNNTAYYTMLD